MQLKPNTLLQGGKYKIIRSLGQGGFGITYEAEQVLLRRKVAVKEFFMKDCCEREDATSRVTVGTGSQRALVEKFRGKFIREAQMIAGMEHPHIIRVTDVFEENGTAYYVMDYLPGGSLVDQVKRNGPLSEDKAEKYIRQVADALNYIHSQNTVHLDVKPSNILLNAKGEAILIDFGISKHYDDSGDQTSSTPVGISKGYAPLEQGRDGDVSQFKPSTDIYALGATLYYLLSGIVPPEASIVNEDGLTKPQGISGRIWEGIEKAMRPRRKDRPQDIDGFLALLDGNSKSEYLEDDEDKTVFIAKEEKGVPANHASFTPNSTTSPFKATWLWTVIVGIILFVAIGALLNKLSKSSKSSETSVTSSTLTPQDSNNSTNKGATTVEIANTKKEEITPAKNTAETKPADSVVPKKKEEKPASATTPKIRLEQNRYEYTAYLGHEFYMGYTAAPGRKVYWSSSNPSVLAVDGSGKITVRGSGTATITATVEDEHDSCVCVIHFKPQEKESSSTKATSNASTSTSASSTSSGSSYSSSSNMYISQTTATLKKGETLQLKAYNYGRSLVWESNKPQIATVSSSGLVRAVSPGEVRIWATGDDNVSRLCTVTVLHTTYSPPTSSGSSEAKDMTLSDSEITLKVGQTFRLKAYNYGKSLKWESLKPEVATVSSSGVVRAVSPGRARIWVTGEGDVARTCSVIVQR